MLLGAVLLKQLYFSSLLKCAEPQFQNLWLDAVMFCALLYLAVDESCLCDVFPEVRGCGCSCFGRVLWTRCHGMHYDLVCCIVLRLVVNVGCCPAELCSDHSASGHGPGWMREESNFDEQMVPTSQMFGGLEEFSFVQKMIASSLEVTCPAPDDNSSSDF
ncbi:hypothetical protein Nepgr_007979 [Nepenthes gracilis]|uniref:Uncharacterized protein n=1 Tax=Nepenthes gracilis TaxID=150966 RepID=A0AAD3S838_NEPGR|nr:hypothetical protein Nepgr_007979 [Nepenthes gracilis]